MEINKMKTYRVIKRNKYTSFEIDYPDRSVKDIISEFRAYANSVTEHDDFISVSFADSQPYMREEFQAFLIKLGYNETSK
jgi:hypothetical protein